MSMNGLPISGKPLGMVLAGSLTRGVDVRLDGDVSVEDVKVGTFATIQGERQRFFGIISEVSLGNSDSSLEHTPPDVSDPFVRQVLAGTAAYGRLSLVPQLTLPVVLGHDEEGPQPAKTIPAHFSRVFSATQQDVSTVFGDESDKDYFYIGSPLDMEAKVCLNLQQLAARSVGIFGKSGTGKTFLTRLLLAGILQQNVASMLVFDMHNDYGWQGIREGGTFVKGLKQLFSSQVAVFSLDPESSRRRGLSPDEEVLISYSDIDPEDVEVLKDNLGLSDVASSAAYDLQRHFRGSNWVKEFLDLQGRAEVSDLANTLGVNAQALGSLYNRLSRLKRYDFMSESAVHDSVTRILDNLTRGKHVVLEFGRWGNDTNAYILVSNLLTRRIHERYVRLKEQAEGGAGAEPRPLIITIEEAHKFLNPAVASQTIFGTIAREMRKYNVTLMVIDQRPGAIDSEVMSQVGTKLTCLLDNERDVDAVLAGVPGSREMRALLSRLEPQQQALIFGHAVPMPIVVRTREYGSGESYLELTRGAEPTRGESAPSRPGPSRSSEEATPLSSISIDDLFR